MHWQSSGYVALAGAQFSVFLRYFSILHGQFTNGSHTEQPRTALSACDELTKRFQGIVREKRSTGAMAADVVYSS